jgi:uncharacterized membrane protein YfcA
MSALLICLVTFLAAALTFVSGFGLGTILLPVFALLYPLPVAIAATAVVHLLNNLFKLLLVGRRADWRIVVRFGLPALVAALAGAALLLLLGQAEPVAIWSAAGLHGEITWAKLAVGGVLLLVTLLELVPRVAAVRFSPAALPVGGLLSGFLGGLSGMQGALRAAFLVRLNLSKEAFVATGAVVATLVDLARLGVYGAGIPGHLGQVDARLLAATVGSAFLGVIVGIRVLAAVTSTTLHRLVAIMLVLAAIALMAGLV